MANCGKCGAELIGSAKFCATCGSPVVNPPPDNGPNTVSGAGGPSPGSALDGPSAVISGGGYDPPSHVNPFAATASPSNPVSVGPSGIAKANPSSSSKVPVSVVSAASGIAATAPAGGGIPFGGAPPAPPTDPTPSNAPPKSQSQPPASGNSQVSPLAVSNAISQRNAFKEVMENSGSGGTGFPQGKERQSVPPAAPGSNPSSSPAPSAVASSAAAQQPPAPAKKKAPGTQMMVNAPLRPLPKPGESDSAVKSEAALAPKKNPPARTVAMGFNPAMAKLGLGGGAAGAGAAGAPQSVAPQTNAPQSSLQQPPTPQQPQSVLQPPSGIMAPSHVQPHHQPPPQQQPHAPMPPSVMQPPQPSMQQPSGIHAPSQVSPYNQQGVYPQQQPPQQPPAAQYPSGPGGWGWNAPQQQQPQPPQQQAPQSAYNPYPFAYTPGSRVHVTWSNGQRYPATVNQVSGSQCLVMFPDGQQHWVEMQYLSPG